MDCGTEGWYMTNDTHIPAPTFSLHSSPRPQGYNNRKCTEERDGIWSVLLGRPGAAVLSFPSVLCPEQCVCKEKGRGREGAARQFHSTKVDCIWTKMPSCHRSTARFNSHPLSLAILSSIVLSLIFSLQECTHSKGITHEHFMLHQPPYMHYS